jgi:hypothetical protein
VRQIISIGTDLDQMVESPAVQVQLSSDRGIAAQPRQQEMRGSDQLPHAFLVQESQRLERLRDRVRSVIHAGHEVVMDIGECWGMWIISYHGLGSGLMRVQVEP